MGQRNSIWAIRWVITALMLALGVALVARGSVIVGGLVAAIAVLRMVLFVRLRRRGNELRERWGDRGPLV